MNELGMFIYKTEMDSQPLSGMFLINISLAYHFQKYCRLLSSLTEKSPDSTWLLVIEPQQAESQAVVCEWLTLGLMVLRCESLPPAS